LRHLRLLLWSYHHLVLLLLDYLEVDLQEVYYLFLLVENVD
jgi:hypothetical protein